MDTIVGSPPRSTTADEPGVVAASVYADGRRVAEISVDQAGEWSKKPGHVVWIGLLEPSYTLLARIQAQLDLHYLAIEDAGKAHQHPMSTPEGYCSRFPEQKCSTDASKKASDIGGLLAFRALRLSGVVRWQLGLGAARAAL